LGRGGLRRLKVNFRTAITYFEKKSNYPASSSSPSILIKLRIATLDSFIEITGTWTEEDKTPGSGIRKRVNQQRLGVECLHYLRRVNDTERARVGLKIHDDYLVCIDD
jgi:hypothetical protein